MRNIIRHSDERGFALATAVLALVVVGALVTAGFFAASQEGQVGTSNAQADLAFYIAEQGLQNAAGTVRKSHVRNLAVGAEIQRNGTVTIGGRTVGNYAVDIRSMGGEMYFVESTGTVTQGGRYAGAQRRLGMVTRTMKFNVPMTQALMAYGGINLQGNATVSGVDTHPTQWNGADCDSLAATEAGVMAKDITTVQTQGSVQIYGNPPIEEDPSMQPGDFTDYGDVHYNELTAMANKTLPASNMTPTPTLTASGACNTTDPNNWGEPLSVTHACYSYFPIIHVSGTLTVQGSGRGQGILLVDGDLKIGGRFEFYGIIIVMGSITRQGSGTAEFHGVVLTQNNADIGDQNTMGGTPEIQFSTCAVQRSINENDALSRLFPIEKRSWMDLTGAGYTL